MRRVSVLALLIFALAACGGDDSSREGSAAAGAATDTAEPGTSAATDTGEPGTGAAADPDTPTSSDGDAGDAAASSPPSPSSTSPPRSGGGSSGSSRGVEPQQAAPLPGLPSWTAGYRRWTRVNAAPIPPTDSDPHLGTKNVYASRSGDRGVYPPGTIVVKEAYRPGKDFIGLVATMRKLPGRNPEHNDWVFVEWARESASEPFRELARGEVCTACHAGVADQDYVFTTG